MRGSVAIGDQLVLHVQVGQDFGLSLRSVNTQVEQIDQVSLVDHAVAATGSVQSLLHAGHDVVLGLFQFVLFFGDLILADLLQELGVLVHQEVHLAQCAVDVVLSAFKVAVQFQNLDLHQLTVKRIGGCLKVALFLLQLVLLLAQADVGFLQSGAGAVDFGQGVLDGSDRRNGRHVQCHLHELAVGLVEVAGVACDSRHPVLDVFQHHVVLWLCYGQSGVHVAKNKVVAQVVLLFVGGAIINHRWSWNNLQVVGGALTNLQNLRHYLLRQL